MASHTDPDRIAALRASLAHTLAERDALREALRPFARVAVILDKLPEGSRPADDSPMRDSMPGMWPTVGDCRRAAGALIVSAVGVAPATLADLAAAHAALAGIEGVADAALREDRARRHDVAPKLLEALEEIAEQAREGRS